MVLVPDNTGIAYLVSCIPSHRLVHTRLCALTHILPYAYHTYNYIIPMNMNPTCPSYSNNLYNYTIPMNLNPQRPPYSHHPYKYTIPMNRNPPNLQRPPYSHHPYKYTVSNHRMNPVCLFRRLFRRFDLRNLILCNLSSLPCLRPALHAFDPAHRSVHPPRAVVPASHDLLTRR